MPAASTRHIEPLLPNDLLPPGGLRRRPPVWVVGIARARRTRISPAPPPFSPLNIAGCILWLDPSDASTVTLVGTVVSAVADKSPAGTNVTAAGSARPSWGRQIGGLPALDFDGANNVLSSATFTRAQPFSVFGVAKHNAATHANASGDQWYGSTAGATTPIVALNSVDFFGFYAGASNNVATGDARPHVHGVLFNGAASAMEIDGVSLASGVNGGANGYAGESINIGSALIGAGGGFPGQVGEVIVYNAALNAANRAVVEQYLVAKWLTEPPLLQGRMRQGRTFRGLPQRRNRTRVETVPAQLNPPIVATEVVQPRRIRGLTRWRARAAVVVPPQLNPPLVVPTLVQPRRIRGLVRRRGRGYEAPVNQVVVTTSDLSWQLTERGRTFRGLVRRRGVSASAPIDQLAPLPLVGQPQTHRRGLRRRVVARAEVVPPQLNPPYPTSEISQPRRLRGFFRTRRPRNEAPLTQTAITFSDLSWQQQLRQSHTVRGVSRARGHSFPVVPPQLNPPYPPAQIREAHTVRGISRARGRRADAPLDQLVPVAPVRAPRRVFVRRPRARVEAPLTQAIVTFSDLSWQAEMKGRTFRGALQRRNRTRAEVVPPQLNPLMPLRPVGQPRRIRGLVSKRSRTRAEVVTPARIYFPKIRLF